MKKGTVTKTATVLFLVGVSGFEPEASWTRTKRDTKLRHTPMDLYYTQPHIQSQEWFSPFRLRECAIFRKLFPSF